MKKYASLVFVVILIILISTPFWAIKIKTIDCQSQYGPCSTSLNEKIAHARGLSLFQARRKLEEAVKNEIYVSDFSTRYQFPDHFLLDVIERKAVTAFIKEGENSYFLVDKEGVVINVTDGTSLPTLTVSAKKDTNFSKGQKVSRELETASSLLSRIFLLYGANEGRIDFDYLTVKIPNSKTIIFPLSGEVDVLLGSLQTILSRLNTKSDYSIIDLRYKNPVLR